MIQLALPGLEMRPVCPICGEAVDLIGQYAPTLKYGVCRACSLAQPYPVELFVPDPTAQTERQRWRIDPEASTEARTHRVAAEDALIEAVNAAAGQMVFAGGSLRPRGRRPRPAPEPGGGYMPRGLPPRQGTLPLCDRCGCGHDNWIELTPGQGSYRPYCQRCYDEMSVESYWRMRSGPLAGMDAESALDRIYQVRPELFERGVLPDYWFALAIQAGEVDALR